MHRELWQSPTHFWSNPVSIRQGKRVKLRSSTNKTACLPKPRIDADGWPTQAGQEIEVKAGQRLTLTTRGGRALHSCNACFGCGSFSDVPGPLAKRARQETACDPRPRARNRPCPAENPRPPKPLTPPRRGLLPHGAARDLPPFRRHGRGGGLHLPGALPGQRRGHGLPLPQGAPRGGGCRDWRRLARIGADWRGLAHQSDTATAAAEAAY